MFTIGGSTGIILENDAVDLGLHDTYYVVAHVHFVLSVGGIIAIFSGIFLNGEKNVGTKNLLLQSSCTLSIFHCNLIFMAVLLTLSPMHFLGFYVMPRRILSRLFSFLERRVIYWIRHNFPSCSFLSIPCHCIFTLSHLLISYLQFQSLYFITNIILPMDCPACFFDAFGITSWMKS